MTDVDRLIYKNNRREAILTVMSYIFQTYFQVSENMHEID